MTDGTSQGLFIVVAIVIFGIFVVLAYILFEDTLSPALANMFTDATEQASKRLNEGIITPTDENLFDFDKTTQTITAYTGGAVEVVVIPDKIQGVDVKVIGKEVFKDIRIDSVYISDNVVTLDIAAFFNTKLKEIHIGKNVKRINESAFAYNNLTELTLPKDLEYIGVGAFRGMGQVKELEIPKSVTHMGNNNISFLPIETLKMTQTLYDSVKNDNDFFLNTYKWNNPDTYDYRINHTYHNKNIVKIY